MNFDNLFSFLLVPWWKDDQCYSPYLSVIIMLRLISVYLKSQSSDTQLSYCAFKKTTLTLGLFILAWRPPADAGLVFVQIEEPHESLGAAAELQHLGPHLHGAHAFLHCRQENTKQNRQTKTRNIVKRETAGMCTEIHRKAWNRNVHTVHVFIQEICMCTWIYICVVHQNPSEL